jgi:hypothetical protein
MSQCEEVVKLIKDGTKVFNLGFSCANPFARWNQKNGAHGCELLKKGVKF